jgi:hypothetical protein
VNGVGHPADDVAAEQREAGRDLDPAGVLRGRDRGVRAVHAHRRADRAGQPVDRDIREDLVPGEGPLDVAAAVAPRPQLLQDPRRQPGGRVGEPDGGGLWVNGSGRGESSAMARGPAAAAPEATPKGGRDHIERSGPRAATGFATRNPAGRSTTSLRHSLLRPLRARLLDPHLGCGTRQIEVPWGVCGHGEAADRLAQPRSVPIQRDRL